MAFTDISLWAFTFALLCFYHILETLFTLETSAVVWSLGISLQPVVILDKHCRNSWAHLNSLHWFFSQENILSELFCPFLSWQNDLNEKKVLFLVRLPSKENLSASNTHQQLLLTIFFNFYLFSKSWLEWFTRVIPENHYDFWDRPGYEVKAG